MLGLTLTGLSLALAGSLVKAGPTDLVGRNNGSGDYKSKCLNFRVSGIDIVVQAVDSIYYAEGAKINITGLQSSLVASDLPRFCSKCNYQQ